MNTLGSRGSPCLHDRGRAHADCLKGNAGIPPGANTTDPSAPFYIDTSGLDFKTSAADPRPQESQLSHRRPNCPTERFLRSRRKATSSLGRRMLPRRRLTAQDGAPTGKVFSFTMSSNDSTVFNPGLIRDDPDGCLNASVFTGQTAPGDKSNLLVPTAHAGIWTRSVDVYVPAGYAAGSEAPFIVVGDSGYPSEKQFFTVLDNLIQQASNPADRRNQHRRRRAGRSGERARVRV